ncbi:PLP-dependent transferase [Candidatus Vidania fulgoroideorum]
MKKKTKIIHRNKKIQKVFCYIKPVYSFTTLYFKKIKKLLKYERKGMLSYGTHGNPNIEELKNVISILEEGKYVFLNSSGLSSIFLTYFSLIKSRDCVLIPDNLYGPNLNIIIFFKKKFKIKVFFYNSKCKYSTLKKIVKKNKIRLIFIEIPGSITFEFSKIVDILKFCKKFNIISIVDNTYSAGVGFKPLKIGFDISVQALTKFQSGCNDVFMGSITTKKKYIYKKIFKGSRITGETINNSYCNMILRSLPTLKMRYLIHEKKAIKLIKWFKDKKVVKLIIHPSVKTCIGYKVWKKHFKRSAGMFSVIFNKNFKFKKICKFIEKLKLFKIGYSWGGAVSLVMIYKNILNNRELYKKYKNFPIVRFYIGMESLCDLKKDIKNALNVFD